MTFTEPEALILREVIARDGAVVPWHRLGTLTGSTRKGVEGQLRRLRAKLRPAGGFLLTVRGAGVQLARPVGIVLNFD